MQPVMICHMAFIAKHNYSVIRNFQIIGFLPNHIYPTLDLVAIFLKNF